MQTHPHLRNFFWIIFTPLSWFWALIAVYRRKFYSDSRQYRSPLKIISVGNLHSGGSGKTPLVVEIAQRFSSRQIAVLARGYGGKFSKRGAAVDLADPNGPQNFGDEPWMLKHNFQLNTFIGKNRVQMVRLISQNQTAGLVILDDGFQHLKLARDVDILVINTQKKLSAAHCLPVGELREPLSALARASALVIVAAGEESSEQQWRAACSQFAPTLPVFSAQLNSSGLWHLGEKIDPDPNSSWISFCGIAEPASFQALTGKIDHCWFAKAYPDHHAYSEKDLDWLLNQQKLKAAAGFITTDKDFSKVHGYLNGRGAQVLVLRINYELPESFWHFLEKCLEQTC